MSKQYLAQHTIDDAHRIDIYALAATSSQILSASGESSIKIHSSAPPDFSILQVLKAAHRLGCHHLVTSGNGSRAVSVGFGGEVKVWRFADGVWRAEGEVGASQEAGKKNKTADARGEVWAVALSGDGRYLADTTYDGRVDVWDLLGDGSGGEDGWKKIREYETKGSFGLSVDLSPDGRFTASGHQSGSIYLFSNDTGRLLHSLPGLVQPVRAVAFSPGNTLLAAAGDARVVALYDFRSGEQVAHLTGHAGWITSLSWSATGEYLLSGSLDGKVKVWSVERRECVATHAETDKAVWAVRWLPKGDTVTGGGAGAGIGLGMGGRVGERFVTAGSNCSIAIYREATGG